MNSLHGRGNSKTGMDADEIIVSKAQAAFRFSNFFEKTFVNG